MCLTSSPGTPTPDGGGLAPRSAVLSAVCSVDSDQALTGKALGQGAVGVAGSTRLVSGACALRSVAARPGTAAEEVSCKAWVRGQHGPSAWTFGPRACRTQQYVVKARFCLLGVAPPSPQRSLCAQQTEASAIVQRLQPQLAPGPRRPGCLQSLALRWLRSPGGGCQGSSFLSDAHPFLD